MKPGDLIQIQRRFRVHEAFPSHSQRRIVLPQLMYLNPGDICLLMDLHYDKEEYPIYDYFKVNLYIAGKIWTTTITIENENGIKDFLKVFESPTLLPRG